MQDEHEYRAEEDEDSIVDSIADDQAVDDDSADELCGPKTPLRRPGVAATSARTATVQRPSPQKPAAEVSHVRSEQPAPVRRHGPTPQTHKAYSRVQRSSLTPRPMTVSRGVGRPYVFRDLKPLPQNPTTPSSDTHDEVLPVDHATSEDDEETVDEVKGRDVALDEDSVDIGDELEGDQHIVQTTTIEVAADDDHVTTDSDEDQTVIHNDVEYEEEENDSTVEDTGEDEEVSCGDDACDAITGAADTEDADQYEAEDTVIIHRSGPQSPEDESFEEQEDQTSDLPDMDDIETSFASSQSEDEAPPDFEESDLSFTADVPIFTPARRVETIMWENLREDVTIPINLDAHLNHVRSLPQLEYAELMDIDDETELVLSDEDWQPTTAEALGMDKFVDDAVDDVVRMGADGQDAFEQNFHDDTMNLSDFVDVSALVEPTERLTLPAPATPTAEREMSRTRTPGKIEQDLDEDQVATPAADEGSPEQTSDADNVPHYARPTISFRRKSLPVISRQTPVRVGERPQTSEGASMPRIVRPFTDAWWSRSPKKSPAASPSKRRQSSSRLGNDIMSPDTPITRRTSIATRKEDPITPGERYPALRSRTSYSHHAATVSVPTRFHEPEVTPFRRPASARKPDPEVATPTAFTLRPRRQSGAFSSVEEAIAVSPSSGSETSAATPTPTPRATPAERFPRLAPRDGYDQHVRMAATPRSQTPSQTPLKRPATAHKPETLRKRALMNSTPSVSRTPIRTPLKPAVPATPSMEPMTPHPSAPLRGVVALVEVYTLEGASASAPFAALLLRLGAKTTRSWSERVTHVVFKDGSPTTLQRVRLHNKGVEDSGTGTLVHCINSRWVTECDAEGRRVDERDEAYAVDIDELPRGGKRRRKSMEPSALVNVDGNIVRERSSLGRSSLSRMSIKADSREISPAAAVAGAEQVESPLQEQENKSDDPSSPATPAYIAAPDKLIQRTAPINRMRKLGTSARNKANDRRLTSWNGSG